MTGTSKYWDSRRVDVWPRFSSGNKSAMTESRINAGCCGKFRSPRYSASSSWGVPSLLRQELRGRVSIYTQARKKTLDARFLRRRG